MPCTQDKPSNQGFPSAKNGSSFAWASKAEWRKIDSHVHAAHIRRRRKNMTSHRMTRCMEVWPIERLIPYARNARTHSDVQIAQIAASIREFGFNSPILVDSNAGII